jgi:hypothetical protein
MVVVRSDRSYCTCLPISTYGGRGATKPGINAAQHAIIYSSGTPPERFVEEHNILPNPIEVIKSRPEERPLDPYSRVNLGKCYTVEYNVQVRNLGLVAPASLPYLVNSWRMVNFDNQNTLPRGDQSEALARITDFNVNIEGGRHSSGAPFGRPAVSNDRWEIRTNAMAVNYPTNYSPSEATYDSSQTLVDDQNLTPEELFMYPGRESRPRSGIKEVDRATMVSQWQETLPEIPEDLHSTLSTVHERVLSELRAFGSELVNVDVDIPWELAGFLSDGFAPGQALGAVLILNGTAKHAHALTIAEYLGKTWGSMGGELLDVLESALSEVSSKVSSQCFKSKSDPFTSLFEPSLSVSHEDLQHLQGPT